MNVPLFGNGVCIRVFQRNKIKHKIRDFPGGPVVKNPPSNPGDTDSIPGQGTKIPQTAGQLSQSARTTESGCYSKDQTPLPDKKLIINQIIYVCVCVCIDRERGEII